MAQDCTVDSEHIIFDNNNVEVTLPNSGALWTKENNEAGYIFPKSSGASAIFGGEIWISAKDRNGNLKFSKTSLDPNSKERHFYPGPFEVRNEQEPSPEVCNNWNKHFQINCETVRVFREDWRDNRMIDGALPDEIFAVSYTHLTLPTIYSV